RNKLARLGETLRDAAGAPAGIGRHAILVAALIEAGELAQGLADALFLAAGRDACSTADAAAMALLARIAAAVRLSWDSGFAHCRPLPEAELRACAATPLPAEISSKRAEGFALYSLYPESYLEALRTAALDPGRPTRVVGIRSIGVPLAAVVAAGLDAAPPPLTVRPVGELPDRELALADDLAAELLADAGSARFAVVDEGPGLSGSSFGAVADFLEDRGGVAPERIHFFASHVGPLGPSARPRHRRRWDKARRYVAELSSLLHQPRRPEHRLEAWVVDLVGAPEAPLQEICGGNWRPLRYAREEDWPASNLYLERRKFLLRGSSGTWLLKFAGLGREGARKLDRARTLHAAGFVPEVVGYRHGFLVERWLGEAPSLDRRLASCDRAWLVTQVGRYLGFRARHFPAEADRGASLARLWEMARYNSLLAFGEAMAARLDRWQPRLGRLERAMRRVEIDGRPHAWEWLLGPDGRLLKTDALDHHAAHDIVGCQDIAWDIAGATIELGLSPPERDRLCGIVEAEAGQPVDAALLALLTPCYLALQMGDRHLATEIAAAYPAEVARLKTSADRYATRLREELLGGI
ncbi:MAG TPA: hypothetical protein VFY87_21040, partial [Geminicoccaceae bacterium]|nr:hypothetical protein [Geminicoccaceae bacterium]